MTDCFAAFLLGLVSSGHCLGMCGGLMVAAGFNASKPSIALGYNLGRLLTYVLLGLSFGAIAAFLPADFIPFLKLVSAVLLVLTSLYLLGISQLVNKLEIIGIPLWTIAQKQAKRLLPVKSIPASILLGLFWGFIPCGLVYTALAFSLSKSSALESATIMLSFGVGTLPAMIGASVLAVRIRPALTHPVIRASLAILLLLFALFIVVDAFL